MKELVQDLIEALREELKEYGEMLALLERQHQMVTESEDLLKCAHAIQSQAETIAAARQEREQRRSDIAARCRLPKDAGFNSVIPLCPPEYQPLVQALVQENNALLIRVQQRARQNDALLERIVGVLQHPPALRPQSPESRSTSIDCDDATTRNPAIVPNQPVLDPIR